MSTKKYKKIFFYLIITLIIFLTDRLTKIYILDLAGKNQLVDVYITNFLNIYLIWNKGIAFGMFSYNDSIVYNVMTLIIIIITIIILVMIIKSEGFKKCLLLFVFGGSLGNIYDRIYYSAVPDFIDFHINNFHWFVFNVADIFITLGIISLILVEIFNNKNDEKIT